MYGKTKIARAKQLKLSCGKMAKPFMVAMKGYEMLPIKLSKDVSEREEGLKKTGKNSPLIYRGRVHKGQGRESEDKGTGSARVGCRKREILTPPPPPPPSLPVRRSPV